MATENIVLEGRSRRAIERIGHFGPTKIRLDKGTDEIVRRLARAYGRGWQVVRGEALAMSNYAAEQAHAGRGLSARDIARLDRVDRALHALERQVRDLDRFAGVQILGGANRQYRQDVDAVLNSLAEITGLDRRFTKPSGAAMEALVLRSTDRIESSTRRLEADQATALKDSLLRGLVYGDNPRDTARRVFSLTEGAFFGGLSRANTLARTELADAHRYATRLAYNESEYVTGWKWLAQLSPRTCPACWAMHGTFHEKTEVQYGHANCRCTTIPVLLDDEPEDHDLGNAEEIFWGLPREEQLQIMGPGRLQALEAGVRWTDLTHLRHNADWRPSYQVTRVSDLQGLAELNVATFPGDVIEIPGMENSSVMSMAYRQGGMTIHALTGEQPTSGFVVARRGTSAVIDAREFFGPKGPHEFAAWMKRHGDRLDEPGAHVGMWYDTANGKVVLDVVEIVRDRETAIALGRAEDQIAIFDLDTFSEIQTGGTGGYTDGLMSALGEADIGREAVIHRNGEDHYGEVIAAGGWGIRIRTSDGTEINAAPGQFYFESNMVQQRVDRIKEVQKIAAEADHGIPVDYTGFDPKAAKEADDAFDSLVSDWQGVAPTRASTSRLNGAYATTTTSFPHGPFKPSKSFIQYEREFAKDYQAWSESMLAAEERGHFHQGTHDEPAEYTTDHEFGHVLDYRVLGPPGSPQRMTLLADVFNELIDPPVHEQASADYVEPMKTRWHEFMALVEKDLSYYGSTDPGELIAEGFAVFRDHGPGKSRVADTVVKHLTGAYLAEFGRLPTMDGIAELLGLEET